MRSRWLFSLVVPIMLFFVSPPPSVLAAADLLQEGVERLSAGDTAGAILALERAAQEAPESVPVRLWLAKAYYLGLESEKAISEWRKVLELSPGNEEATEYLDGIGDVNKRAADRHKYSEELFRIELYVLASEEAKRTLEMTDPGEYAGKLRLLRARCSLATDKPLGALQAARELVSLHPDDPIIPKARVFIASILGEKLGRVEEAKREIQSILDDYPGTEAAALAELELSRIAAATGRPLEAVEGYKAWLTRYAESDEAPDAMLELAKLYVKLGELAKPDKVEALISEHGKAIEMLSALEEKHPGTRAAGKVMGVMEGLVPFYVKEEAFDVSAEIVEEMAGRYSTRPEHPDILIQLSHAMNRLGIERFKENERTGASEKNEELLPGFARAVKLSVKVMDGYPQKANDALKVVLEIIAHYRNARLWEPAMECARLAIDEEVRRKGAARLMGELVKLNAESADDEWLRDEKAGRKIEAALRSGHLSAVEAYVRLVKLHAGSPEVAAAQERLISVANEYEGAGFCDVAREIFESVMEAGVSGDWAALQAALVTSREGTLELIRSLPGGMTAVEIAQLGLSEKLGRALGQLEKVMEDFPESEYAATARGKILEIGKAYESKRAFSAAREVYTSFLKTPAAAGRDEFEYALAASSYDEAAWEFHRATPKPAGLTPKLEKAVKELVAFVKANPRSEYAEEALRKALSVGWIYAGAGNWEVARGAFELFAQEDPELGDPFRIELLAALCYVGEAMPDYALGEIAQVLGKQEMISVNVSARTPARGGNVPAQQQQQVQAERPSAPAREVEVALISFPKAYERLKGVIAGSADESQVDRATNIVNAMSGFYRQKGKFIEAAGLLERLLTDFPKVKGPQQTFLTIAELHLEHARNLSIEREEDGTKLEEALEAALGKYRDFIKRWPDSPLANKARRGVVEGLIAAGARVMEVSQPRAAFFLESATDEVVRLNGRFGEGAAAFSDGWASGMLARVAQVFSGNEQWEEAAVVLLRLARIYPNAPEAGPGVMEVARIYSENLDQPIDALDLYMTYMAGWGRPDEVMGAVYGMGNKLANEQRWVEAKLVFETYAAAFPKAPNAPDALEYVAKVYEEGRAWASAIDVYKSIIAEYPSSNAARNARLRIPVCHADLSKWYEAAVAASKFVQEYPQDPAAGQMRTNAQVYWTLKNYQDLVSSEDDSKKLDEAQYQLATIVLEKLGDKVKAAEEFEKVVEKFSKSYRADDAKFSVGKILLDLGKLEEAREEFLDLVKLYPESDKADDALYWAGVTYEREAKTYEVLTKEEADRKARMVAQEAANVAVAEFDAFVSDWSVVSSKELRQKYQQAAKQPQMSEVVGDNILVLAEAGAKAGAWEQQRQAYRGFARYAMRRERELAALQLANKEDKRKEALRNAVALFERAAEEYQLGDLADEALLSAAKIAYEVLKETARAMKAYQLLAQHYPGSPIAEEAAYRIGDFYQTEQKWAEAIKAFEQFIYNYPKSGRAADAQFAIGECYVQLRNWTKAIDAFQAYVNKYPQGSRVQEAKERMDWIRAYYL